MFEAYGLNRYLCDCIEDIRTLMEEMDSLVEQELSIQQPLQLLKSLITEMHIYGKRMEASLYDVKDLDSLHNRIKDDKKKLRKLQKSIEKLEKEEEKLKLELGYDED